MKKRLLFLVALIFPALPLLALLSLPMACKSHTGTASTSNVSLDEMVGAMLMVGFRGTVLEGEHHFLRQLRDLCLGGVVLFDYDVPSRTPERNIESRSQVRRLVASLKAAAKDKLFVAVDQEGGRVARLKPERGFPATLSQERLGQRNNEEETRRQAAEIAKMLSELGINVNFAPVLDLNVNPENPIIGAIGRSYAPDPETVVRHARWTIEEFHEHGILAVVKHFPGHGSSLSDSHLGLPDVTDTWTRQELEPYRQLVEAGLPDMVMTAHLFNRHWDPAAPATLSRSVIKGMLRDQLGFEGPVVSDDLGMGAIVENFSLEEAIEMGIGAGLDILVFGNNQKYDPEIARKAFDHLKKLVTEGKVSRPRIEESYRRIQEVKARLP